MSSPTPTLKWVQCLICCKKTESSKNWDEQSNIEQRQRSVFYLLNKLLSIPSQMAASYLEKFGSSDCPERCLDLCPDCSSLVDNGQQLFNQIQELEQRHKEIEEKIKMRVKVTVEMEESDEILGQGQSQSQAHVEIRRYLDNLNVESSSAVCSQIKEESEGYRDQMEFEGEFSVKVEEVKVKTEQIEQVQIEVDPLTHFGLNQNDEDSESSSGSEFEPPTPKSRSKSKQAGKRSFKKKTTKNVSKSRAKCEKKETKTPKIEQKDQTLSTVPLPVLIKCGTCTQSFLTVAELDAHGEKGCEKQVFDPYPILPNGETGRGCEECGAAFDNPGSLEIHMRSKHLEQDALKCQGCFEYFKTTIHYQNHYRKLLIREPWSNCVRLAPPPCKLKGCQNIARSSPAAMELHKKIYHSLPNQNLLFKCPACERTFGNASGLACHMQHCCKKLFLE